MEKYHRSVLLQEVLDLLTVRSGGRYADLTFGEGGHTEAILARGASHVSALDRDEEALDLYRKSGALRDNPRLVLLHGRLSAFSPPSGEHYDGILVDLGVSTRQLLKPERGFSFQQPGPLDMRMDPSAERTLERALSEISEEELALALEAVEGRPGTKMARRILQAWKAGQIRNTSDLARLAGPKREKRHPATALFLALRILVNDELTEIETGLPRLIDFLVPGGRLAVISFHSTEDRLVKRIFLRLAGRCICEERICICPRETKVSLVTRKPLVASAAELAANPRARSAKLRCVEKPGSSD
jgi:16S rRNA (cytosine1402-N4)-methyltransferase